MLLKNYFYYYEYIIIMDLKFLNISNNEFFSFKKYKYYYFSLIFCLFLIFYFIFRIFFNIHTNDGKVLTLINSIYTSLILASVSFISIIFSSLNNKKILDQNDESRFIELRFQDSKYAIYNLIEFIQKTCTVYKQLKDFLNKNREYESNFLSPRDFLIMQFIIIITDKDLLIKLPLHIKSKLQFKFDDEIEYCWDERADETVEKINCHLGAIGEPLFSSEYVYDECVLEFNKIPHFEYNLTIFKAYISSNISEEEFLSHFINILNEISSTNLDDLILKDKEIKLDGA